MSRIQQANMDVYENEVAFCFLKQYGDDQNKISLLENFLLIKTKGREHFYPLSFLDSLGIQNRKLIFYVVAGGVLSSLCTIALITGFYNPWLVLVLLFLGLFSLYYGWLGNDFLIVRENNGDNSYVLPHSSKNLESFIAFVNERLKPSGEGSFIYHIMENQEWVDQAGSKNPITNKSLSAEGFIHASLQRQLRDTLEQHFKPQQELWLIKIDLLKIKPEVRFERSPGSEDVFPHVYGPINREAVVDVSKISGG